MPDTIELLNPFLRKNPISVMHFYDGRAPIKGGVVTIPTSKPHWVQRALIMGFKFNPDGTPYRRENPQPATVEVALVEDSAESAGDTSEGTDGGGLPAGEDGLRESEQPRDGSDDGEGDGGSVGDGVADDPSGDGTPA